MAAICATAAYISMVQKRQHIIEDLSVLSEMNIVLSNQRFEEAERDAKNLMYQCSLATEIHHNDIFLRWAGIYLSVLQIARRR